MAERNSLCVGIDLGTTNSLIATCKYENGKIITPVKKVQRAVDRKGTKRNDALLPSFVYYPEEWGASPIVGDVAKECYSITPFRVAKSIKSQMGKPTITGLQDGIEDKLPEEVSARIIRHLVADLEKYYGEEIKDVVITVPASFDWAQRLATLRAAELAGVDVRNEDGSYDQYVLLSEPEAVMYSVINQIRNGEYDANLSFDNEKKVLVFDIGGGTLDITLHSVRKNQENPEILDMDCIATNRFTPVAGDTFDACTAEAMYRQYVEQYRQTIPGAAEKIAEKKNIVMPYLCMYAEALKIDINNLLDDLAYRKKTLSNDYEFACGGIMPTAYSYDGYFTKQQYEESVRPLLGLDYCYEDYKTIENRTRTNDIIWPVLDVLQMAAKKLQTDEVKIDAVIMSGGMSRLYLIKERLEKFFGFHVISVSNPDQAVAQGAVVYHYHQHNDSELMKRLHAKEHTEPEESESSTISPPKETVPEVFIHSGKSVLPEAIFLGLHGGANIQLAEDGQELPYYSEVISGFFVGKGQNVVYIPIRKRGTHPGEFLTIASGDIHFQKSPAEETPVSIRFSISRNQIITMEAWMTKNDSGIDMGERGAVTFSFREEKWKVRRGAGEKIRPPAGSRLIAYNEIESLCRLSRSKNTQKRREQKKAILTCGNPEDFAAPMLRTLDLRQNDYNICLNLIPVARKLAQYWTKGEQKRLVKFCFELIRPMLYGFSASRSLWINVSQEAILTIGVLGNVEDAERLFVPGLLASGNFDDALIQAFGWHGLHVDWINAQMDKGKVVAIRWIGFAVNKARAVERTLLRSIVQALTETAVAYGSGNQNCLIDAAISLGLLCDRNAEGGAKADEEMCNQAKAWIKAVEEDFGWIKGLDRAGATALKLICGKTLDKDEEDFLLNMYDV